MKPTVLQNVPTSHLCILILALVPHSTPLSTLYSWLGPLRTLASVCRLRISSLLVFPASLVVRFLVCTNSINITDSYYVLPSTSLSNHIVSPLLHGVMSGVVGVVGPTEAWNRSRCWGKELGREGLRVGKSKGDPLGRVTRSPVLFPSGECVCVPPDPSILHTWSLSMLGSGGTQEGPWQLASGGSLRSGIDERADETQV